MYVCISVCECVCVCVCVCVTLEDTTWPKLAISLLHLYTYFKSKKIKYFKHVSYKYPHGQNLLNYSTRKIIASNRFINKTKSNKHTFRNIKFKLPQCTPICNRV